MQHRAVAAIREWNARLGQDATYLICSHGDVIKAIVADSLGLHLDQSQRIQADPCSLTVIRYTPMRPFLIRMNDRGGGVEDLIPPADGHGRGPAMAGRAQSDAAVGGGAGGADHGGRAGSGGPSADGARRADGENRQPDLVTPSAPSSRQQSAVTRG
jgi:hypothetical protein